MNAYVATVVCSTLCAASLCDFERMAVPPALWQVAVTTDCQRPGGRADVDKAHLAAADRMASSRHGQTARAH